MKQIFLLFIMSIFCVGCSAKNMANSIFDHPVCKVPCWHNITPGITNEKDALSLLSKITATDHPLAARQSPIDGFDKLIQFSPLDNKDVFVDVMTLNDRVSLIYFEGRININLKHAIELFGQPDSILVVSTNRFDQITLINEVNGVGLGWQLYGGDSVTNSGVEPSVKITQVMFFDQNQYEQILDSKYLSGGTLSGEETRSNVHPWDGYGSFTKKYWPPATPSTP